MTRKFIEIIYKKPFFLSLHAILMKSLIFYFLVYGLINRMSEDGVKMKIKFNFSNFFFSQFYISDVGGWKKIKFKFSRTFLFYSTRNTTTQDGLERSFFYWYKWNILFFHLLYVSNCNLLPKRKTKSANWPHNTLVLLFSVMCVV